MSKILITDTDNRQREAEVVNEKQLRLILHDLLEQEAKVIILKIPNVGIFTVGVGLPLGFIQFSKDGEPPYLVASENISTERTDLENEIVFNAGGTPTPILLRYCLPFDRIIEIIEYCYKYNKLPGFVQWKAI